MISVLSFGFVLLAASAVWESTDRRLGSMDELRTLAAAIESIGILGGLAVLLLT